MVQKDPDRGLFRRGRRWYLRAYIPGQGRKVFALKPAGSTRAVTDKSVARILARQIRGNIRRPSQDQQPSDLPTLIAEFQNVLGLTSRPKQARHNAAVVRRFAEEQEIGAPEQITTPKVQSYLTNLQTQGRAPSTLWNHRAALSRFCGFLKERGLLDSNPARETGISKIEKSVPVFLTEEQVEQALRIAREHGIYAEVAVALHTGLRRSELRRLRWSHIDYEAKSLVVPRSKSGRARSVPLSENAIAVLREQQEVTGHRKHLFPGRRRIDQSGMRRMGWWSDALKPLQERMPTFQERGKQAVGRGWHLLRHTFASHLAQRGVSLQKIGEWLGHTDIRTTQIYSHLVPGYDPDIELLYKPRNGGGGGNG